MLRPIMLSGEGCSLVLDGLLVANRAAVGLPVALELQLPDNARLGAVVRDVLERWTTEDHEVVLELLARPRPTHTAR
jgi:hypothetical protein